MQQNKVIQSLNDSLGRPIGLNEFAHWHDGSTNNLVNVGTWGWSDELGATHSDDFQGWAWDAQEFFFGVSREAAVGLLTGPAGKLMSSSSGIVRFGWGGVWLGGQIYEGYGAISEGYAAAQALYHGDYWGAAQHGTFAVIAGLGFYSGAKPLSKLGEAAPVKGPDAFADGESARIMDNAARSRGLNPNSGIVNMAITRKQALKRIEGLIGEGSQAGIEAHIGKLTRPGSGPHIRTEHTRYV